VTTATLSPRARRDLLDATRWIRNDNPVAAQGLRDAVLQAAQRIAQFPEVGRSRPDLTTLEYRFLPLTGFPYVIVYNALSSPPVIVRVLHGARDLPDILREG
jgi:toxin ParE1/3/4